MTKIIRADPVYRRRFAVFALLAISAVAAIEYFELLDFGPFFEDVESHELAGRLRLVLTATLAPVLFIGFYSLRYGRRLIRSKEFPPPGSKVLTDTVVQIGRPAVIRGWISMVVGLGAIALFCYGAVVVPSLVEKAIISQQAVESNR